MSANIKWKPTVNDGTDLQVGQSSAFINAMCAAFNAEPWELTAGDCQKLYGMAAVHGGPEDANPYLKLIDALGTSRTGIKVWAEY